MTTRQFIFIVLAVFVGGLAAMLAWTLIVKQQVDAQLASGTSSPLLTLLGLSK